jgi:hypothetical protein
MQARKRLGVGMIGGGFVGRFHIRSWLGVRDSDILGVVSRRRETAAEAAALAAEIGVGDAKVFGSVTEMVADPSIDALWILAPNFTRIEIMEEIAHAIEAGPGRAVCSTATWKTSCSRPGSSGARTPCGPAERRSPARRILRAPPRSTAAPTCRGSGRESFREAAS